MEKAKYCMILPIWHPRKGQKKKKLWKRHKKDTCYQKLGGRQGWPGGHRIFKQWNYSVCEYVSLCICKNLYTLTHQEWTLRPTRDFEW